jgi:uroporphyrin-III C-methyltransferase
MSKVPIFLKLNKFLGDNILKFFSKNQNKYNEKRVYLVGCGIGDVELLTIKALRVINSVDVVLYDNLVSDDILSLIPQETHKVYVGKKNGHHYLKQEDTNKLILKYAKENKSVARLKSGDPYIFGRGAEEAEYLVKNNIEVEIVNGISSAISGPACAGIAPTARGYSSGFSVVSAHLAGNKLNKDWLPLLHIKNHTTVVLMGLSFVEHIVEFAKEANVDTSTKVAIVSNASRDNQTVITTTLKDLNKEAKKAQSPAILVFGEVVSLSSVLPHFNKVVNSTYK